MKKFLILLVLFPFLHKSSYEVTYVSCKSNEIIVQHEEESMQLTLFNTKIKNDKGWDYACSVISEANKLEIEIDPSTKIEDPLSVYIFADGKLLQEELIVKGFAYTMIHNPEYTYEKRLEKANATTAVMAPQKEKETKKSYPVVAPIVLGIVILIWGFMLWYGIWYYRKKKNKK